MDHIAHSGPTLATACIRKEYPGVAALKDVSIQFTAGEVHALIGKNGAGKSTLVKLLTGAEQPTSGRILLHGREVSLSSPRRAFEYGMAAVHQEMSLVPELTVAENILLGHGPRKWRGMLVDWKTLFEQAAAVLDKMHVEMDVRKKVRLLGMAEQQVVEIAKAMACNPSVLFFDEPTSALSHDETESLFALIRQLAQQGATIIYITHRLQELQRIVDRVSVIRDGMLVGEFTREQAAPEAIAHAMFGETVAAVRPVTVRPSSETALEVNGLSSKASKLHRIHFTLRKGEILGIAGLLGAGRTELLRCIAGADPYDAGEVRIGGKCMRNATPARMKQAGLGFIPEDRQAEGLVPVLSVAENICLASLDTVARMGVLNRRQQRSRVAQSIRELAITASTPETQVSTLSGGNQQKVVVANRLNTQPHILLFDEPTRGIDVLAKQQIFQIMCSLSEQGISSLFVSSEFEELLQVCHRILIMQNGVLTGEVSPEGLGPQDLLEMCMKPIPQNALAS